MKLLILKILSCCIFFWGCKQNYENQLIENIQLVTQYQVLDEHISPKHVRCSFDDPKKFEEMEEYDCTFKVEEYEFDLEEKFILDDQGNLKEYWTYKSEGPLTYSKQDLLEDPRFLDYIGGDKLNVSLDKKNSVIYSKGNKLFIERVFPKQKLILIKSDEKLVKQGRRLLFEYEEL